MANIYDQAEVMSENNFPSGAGIASSASAFAALAVAGSKAAGLSLSEAELSRLARRGSGSAARSIPGGFVEWQTGTTDEDSFAFSIAEPDHWNLVDCVAIVSASHKKTGSTEGHFIAATSPLQPARVADAPRRLETCRKAILERDFNAFASIVELDSDMMHAVMMTSSPALHYWKPASLEVMNRVRQWRMDGIPACYTVDAGPNVHIICTETESQMIEKRLRETGGVENVLVARAGGPAKIVENGK
jgi:diphosphomevalonate decarboxylase